MGVTPDVLGEAEGQLAPPDAAFGCELPLQAPPEPLSTVDVGPAVGGVIPVRMVDQEVHIPFRGHPGLRRQRVRAHRRPSLDPAPELGEEGCRFRIGHHLCSELAAPTEDPEHGGLRDTPAALGPSRPDSAAPVPPAAQTWVLSISTVPRNTATTWRAVVSRTVVRARRTRCRCRSVSAAIAVLVRPRLNQPRRRCHFSPSTAAAAASRVGARRPLAIAGQHPHD